MEDGRDKALVVDRRRVVVEGERLARLAERVVDRIEVAVDRDLDGMRGLVLRYCILFV